VFDLGKILNINETPGLVEKKALVARIIRAIEGGD